MIMMISNPFVEGGEIEDRHRDVTEPRRAEEELRVSRQQLHALSARLQGALEEERIRIAREVHDQIGQVLTGLNFDLDWLRHRLAECGPGAPAGVLLERIGAMTGRLREAMRTTQCICTKLRPKVLDELGLVAALEWLAEDFEKSAQVACVTDCKPLARPLSGGKATVVFRICQEILTNVARHARATWVRVTLRSEPQSLVLQVEDNGCGISAGTAASNCSLGLLGMKERAMLAGGEINIAGTPGQGTRVTVAIPWMQV